MKRTFFGKTVIILMVSILLTLGLSACSQVLDTLKHLTGHDIAVRVNPAFVRASEVHRLCGAPDKLIGCIGPLPVYPLTECLSAMIQAHATQARPAPL